MEDHQRFYLGLLGGASLILLLHIIGYNTSIYFADSGSIAKYYNAPLAGAFNEIRMDMEGLTLARASGGSTRVNYWDTCADDSGEQNDAAAGLCGKFFAAALGSYTFGITSLTCIIVSGWLAFTTPSILKSRIVTVLFVLMLCQSTSVFVLAMMMGDDQEEALRRSWVNFLQAPSPGGKWEFDESYGSVFLAIVFILELPVIVASLYAEYLVQQLLADQTAAVTAKNVDSEPQSEATKACQGQTTISVDSEVETKSMTNTDHVIESGHTTTVADQLIHAPVHAAPSNPPEKDTTGQRVCC
jgi:hypothetical protein